MNKSIKRIHAISMLFCLALMVGCSSSEVVEEDDHGHSHGHSHEHDHGAMPQSFSAAVTELREIWDTISAAMQSKDADSAHHPLHDVGVVLGATADLAAETDMAEEEWNQVKAEVDKLVVAFNELDSAFHDEEKGESSNFEAIKSTIDDAIASLEAKLSTPEEQKTTVEE